MTAWQRSVALAHAGSRGDGMRFTVGDPWDRDARRMLGAMQLIRAAETVLAQTAVSGGYDGPIHVSLGQEGAAVGIVAGLRRGDVLLSNHRGHGHAIAVGVPVRQVLAEILTGRGGSMHLYFPEHGFLGTNGIVGDNAAIALGPALAAQVKGGSEVTCVVLGDGAMGTGVVYEAMNMAALWHLAIVFCCENNGYAEMTPTSVHLATSPARRAEAFGLATVTADGTDPLEVCSRVSEAAEAARAGQPGFVEINTHRFGGHYVGDPARYRPGGEDAAWQRDFCPIDQLAGRLGVTEHELDATHARLCAQVAAEVGGILGAD